MANPKHKQREYSQRWRDRHPAAKRADSNAWRKANPAKVKAYRKKTTPAQHHAYHLKHWFGMTAADYDRLLIGQNGVCAICEQPCQSGRRLAVDHDHKTNRIRGLLCIRCNRAIGMLRDDPALLRAAAKYLARSARWR